MEEEKRKLDLIFLKKIFTSYIQEDKRKKKERASRT